MGKKLNSREIEKLALNSIDNCIRKRLYRHVKYKRAGLAQRNANKIPCISNSVHEFWNKCISKFETEVADLFFSPDIKLRKSNNPGTNSKLVESVSGESSCEKQSVEDKKCSDDDGAVWITPLYEFASAYDELIRYYYGFSNRMFKLFNELKAPNKLDWLETLDTLDELARLDGFVELDVLDLFGELDELARLDGLDGVDEVARLDGLDEVAELARLDKMFLELCSKICYYNNRKTKKDSLKGSILGNADFKCLPFMLNLQEKNVRELLPYLLTAYTFNSCDSRFFYKDQEKKQEKDQIERQKLVDLICSNEDATIGEIDSIKASKMDQGIKKLSKVFSLENAKIKSTPRQNRPQPYLDQIIPNFGTPLIKYDVVLDNAYQIWCKAILECGYLANIDGFPSDVDWDTCKLLFALYLLISQRKVLKMGLTR